MSSDRNNVYVVNSVMPSSCYRHTGQTKYLLIKSRGNCIRQTNTADSCPVSKCPHTKIPLENGLKPMNVTRVFVLISASIFFTVK